MTKRITPSNASKEPYSITNVAISFCFSSSFFLCSVIFILLLLNLQCKYSSFYCTTHRQPFDGNLKGKKWRNPMKDFNYLPANLHSFQARCMCVWVWVCVCILFQCFYWLVMLLKHIETGVSLEFPEWLCIRNGIRQYHTDYFCTWGGCIEVPFLNTVQLFTHYLN